MARAVTAVSLHWLFHTGLWKSCWFSTRYLIEILRHLIHISDGSSSAFGCSSAKAAVIFCGGFLFIPFFFSTPKEKGASLWLGVEADQHKGKTSIPLPIWILVPLDLLKHQTTLLSFNFFMRKVTRCHCWPLPHYLKNATVPRDSLSLWWLCAPFPPFCQVFSLFSFCPEWPERTEFICWVDYCSFSMSVAILSLFLHCFGPVTFFGQEEGRQWEVISWTISPWWKIPIT